MNKYLLVLIIWLIIPISVFAHPGRTDSSGCHTCRTNCASWGLSTGEYHCHRSKGVTQPIEPVRSIRNEGGTGTTVPAPEYKVPVINTVKTQIPTTPTIKTTPKHIIKPTIEIKKEEKPVLTPAEITPKSNIIPNPSVTEIKKPSAIKNFFNWLF